MDERRAQFFPTPFDKTLPAGAWTTTLKEVWFRGAHCDVGGGYADPGLSDIALEWMLGACMAHGLVFQRGLLASLRPDPLARLHDELQRQPAWRLLGSWPRWHPGGELAPSQRDGACQGDRRPGTSRHDVGRVPAGVLHSGRPAGMGSDRLDPHGGGRALSPDLAVGRMARRGVPAERPVGPAGHRVPSLALPLPPPSAGRELHDALHHPCRSARLAAARRRADAPCDYLFFRDPWNCASRLPRSAAISRIAATAS